jgi:hypothetical protein
VFSTRAEHEESPMYLSPMEMMLEQMHAAQVAGDDAQVARLRTVVEADLAAREAAVGITRESVR